MSVNKYMHPRNVYRKPPDFSQLALKYPEFLQISKLDVNGKVSIDFKDPNALRVLTKCLLHSDFGLNVHIPEDRLVPTLPLRLNYILWIEDLLEKAENINGIDIGTGACAVYPLLAAAKNKWHMTGTENDPDSYQAAVGNVRANNLENFISIKHNATTSLLEHCFAEDKDATYEFCMCNPPFYSSFQELCESRSTARPPPKNGFTGSLPELITEGGEVQFVLKLINESATLKDNIKIFTTMVGHKVSLKELAGELQKRGVQHTHTEFCQGRTTRWGLAWTFRDNCPPLLSVPPRTESRKKNTPMAFVVPPLPNITYDTESVSKQIKVILDRLSISHKLLRKKGHKISMELKAYADTWSNQRRKRRQLKRLESEAAKKSKLEDMATNSNIKETLKNNNVDFESKQQSDLNCLGNKEESTIDPSSKNEDDSTESKPPIKLLSKSRESNNTELRREIILHALLTIGKQDDDIVLDMEFVSGTSGKDGMHQIVQFIKNNWK